MTNSTSAVITKSNEECGIKEVWNSNLEEEFRKIRQISKHYNYVAMDTEFPGVVARPIGEFKSSTDYQYHLLRCNVDLLRLIQVGLTFFNEKGEMPKEHSTWQFNFKFCLMEDMFAQDSIELLQTSGINFKRQEEDGIDVLTFAEFLMTSGLVLVDNVQWLSFHSGYDFGYLLKLLTNTTLPTDESEFFELLQIYFPVIYDVKYLMKSCKNMKGGLQEVAENLQIDRVGPQHQAGSDSLLTGITFFKMRDVFFEGYIDDKKYCGHLYGLGAPYASANTPAAIAALAYEQASALPTSAGDVPAPTTVTVAATSGTSGGTSGGGGTGGIVREGRVVNPSASLIDQSSSSSSPGGTSTGAGGGGTSSTSSAAGATAVIITDGGGGDDKQSSTSNKDSSVRELHSRSGSASASSTSINSRADQSQGQGQGQSGAGADDSSLVEGGGSGSSRKGAAGGGRDEDARSTSSSGSTGRTSSAPSAPTASQESSGSDSSSETSSNAGGGGNGGGPAGGCGGGLDESAASIDV